MFIPIRDSNPTRITPVATWLIMAANVLVWLWQVALEASGAVWVVPGYGMVPARLIDDPAGEAFTALTSMFMHGGWLHLAGNMLYLHIFGDNVEEALGRGRFVLFYLACGAVAAVAQVLVAPHSPVPMVGASGAIAGVLGAYLVLFPRAPILVINTILPLWFLLGFLLVFPAWLAIGTWFVWNLLGGLSSLGDSLGGGVAFFAHLGGFVAGVLLIRLCTAGRCLRQSDTWAGWRPPPRGRPRPDSPDAHPDPWYPPDRYH